MAKRDVRDPQVQKIINELQGVVQLTSAQSAEQRKINIELLKAAELLKTGLATNREDAEKLIDTISKGVLKTDKIAKEWVSKRQGTAQDLKTIVERFKQIDQLTSEMIDDVDDLEDLYATIVDDKEEEFDITKKILNTHSDIEKVVESTRKALLNSSLSVEDMNKQISQAVAESVKFQTIFQEFTGTTPLFNEIQSDIDKLIDNVSGNIIDVKLQFSDPEVLKAKMDKVFASIEKEKFTNLNQLKSYLDDISVDYQDIVDLMWLGDNITNQQKQTLEKQLSTLDITTQQLIKQAALRVSDLDTMKSEIIAQKEMLVLMGKYSNTLSAAEGIVNRVGRVFDDINMMLPAGIGEFIGLQNVSLKLLEQHKTGVQEFVDELQKSKNPAAAMQKYFASYGGMLKSMINPTTLIIAGLALGFKLLVDTVQKYKDLSKELNVSLLQAKQLYYTQMDILTSSENQFTTMQDIADVQKEMIGSSGKVFDLNKKGSKELIIGLTEMGKVFGYGNEQAVKIHKTFKDLGANDELAKTLQTNMGFMAEMAGLSPQIVAQDLIDSAEEVSVYFAGMPESAARAAIQIRRMGLSLKQAGSIAQKMLDLEGFMTDMYELMSMTNQGIDFTDAFDKGLAGDLEGMTDSIMKQIGSLQEFQQMDYLTRTKLAKTMGMSMEDLTKSVSLREKMNGLSADEQKLLNGNLDRMGDITDLNKDQIKDRLKALQSTDRLGVAWDKIKVALTAAVLPIIESIANIISGISPEGINKIVSGIVLIAEILGGLYISSKLIKGISSLSTMITGIGGGTSFIGKMFDVLKSKIPGLSKPLEQVIESLSGQVEGKNIFEKIFDGIKTGVEKILELAETIVDKIVEVAANSIEKLLTSIGKGLSEFNNNALKGSVAMVLLAGATFILAKALQEFANVTWESVFKGLTALTGLVGIAMLMGNLSSQLLMGSLGIALLGASLIPLAYGLNMLNNVDWGSIGKMVVSLVALGALGVVFGALLVPLALGALAITALGASLLVFGTGLSFLGSGISGISKGLDDMGNVLNNLTGTFANLVSLPISNIFMLSAGLIALSGALTLLSATQLGEGLLTTLVGTPMLDQLERLANVANPITILAESLKILSITLTELSTTLDTLNLSKLDKLTNLGEFVSKLKLNTSVTSTGPTKESVAQNVSVGGAFNGNGVDGNNFGNTNNSNIYNSNSSNNSSNTSFGNSNTSRIETLLIQLINSVNNMSNRPNEIVIGNQQLSQLNIALKGRNNNL